MPKEKIAPIVIEDEIIFSPSPPAELSPELAAAVSKQTSRLAPSHAELVAYFSPGREATMELPQVMAAHQVACAKGCGAMLVYIPVAGQDAPELICGNC